jgi:hypothetical protein
MPVPKENTPVFSRFVLGINPEEIPSGISV